MVSYFRLQQWRSDLNVIKLHCIARDQTYFDVICEIYQILPNITF